MGLKTFLENQDLMLWVGLLSRDTGVPASRRLNIRDEVTALSFDLAVTLRLLSFDNDRLKMQAQNIAYEVSKIFAPRSSTPDNDSILESPIIGDKYADGTTQVW